MTQDEFNAVVVAEQDTMHYLDAEFIAYMEELDLQQALDAAWQAVE